MMRQAQLISAVLGVLAVTGTLAFADDEHGSTRRYFIAAEDVVWNFAPTGQNQIDGGAIPEPFAGNTVFTKVRYVEFTDGSFSTPKPQPEWLGLLGPIIRAVVGDTVVVEFRNNSTRGPFGMHPHGFRYTKDNEGAQYLPAGAGAQVPPGGRFTYTWVADKDSGPGPGDPSSLVWWYHSHVDETAETNLGLLGPIVITARGRANPDGTPKGVDREFVTAWFIFDEAQGEERGLMHAVNGYIFGNLPGLVMNNGDRVRWYSLGMGNERDLHTPHWHGKTLRYNRRQTDVIELLPGSMTTADMHANNPGTWLLHCHVGDHIENGMQAQYQILR